MCVVTCMSRHIVAARAQLTKVSSLLPSFGPEDGTGLSLHGKCLDPLTSLCWPIAKI